jgi:hypothetical protein
LVVSTKVSNIRYQLEDVLENILRNGEWGMGNGEWRMGLFILKLLPQGLEYFQITWYFQQKYSFFPPEPSFFE